VKLVAREAWKKKVELITPILIPAKKTREGKASSFPQIRDFLRKKHGISKPQTSSWNADNIVEKWNGLENKEWVAFLPILSNF